MKTVYLAARYTRRLELCGYRDALEQRGIAVTSRWLDGSHQLSDSGVPIGDNGEALVEAGEEELAAALRQKFAMDDLQDVQRADTLIAFTEAPRASQSRGGRHVELGIALGADIPVIIIGPRENVFCWLPMVTHYHTWQDYLSAVDSLLEAR